MVTKAPTKLATFATALLCVAGLSACDNNLYLSPVAVQCDGTDLYVVAVGTDPRTGYSAEVSLGDTRLSADTWLHTDGTVSELPCTGAKN